MHLSINLIAQLKGSFEGLRVVLIGDFHEQPMLHLKIKPFIVGVKDWTGDVREFQSLNNVPLTSFRY
jgi:vacuolar protein sorting-associated protein 13A/C